MLNRMIYRWALRKLKTEPDVKIGPPDAPYLRRWWVIPRNKFFNIYFHEVLTSDDDRALHDHPWVNMSYIIDGAYNEHTIADGGIHHRTKRVAGDVKFRLPSAAHRLELIPDKDGKLQRCLTLFITGPRVREWGFHCPNGWVHWQDFTAAHNKGEIGQGCGD